MCGRRAPHCWWPGSASPSSPVLRYSCMVAHRRGTPRRSGLSTLSAPELAAWLTPITKLFLPAGIAVAAAIAALYSFIRTRSLWPIAFSAGAAATAWALANLAKHAASRPRPYTVVADAVLRQQPAHGSSFPSSHTTVALAVTIALVAFLPRWGAVVAIAYAVVLGWSRIYLGVHYPLDVVAGMGIGCAVGGLTALLERVVLLRPPSTPASPHRAAANYRQPVARNQYGVGM